MNFDAQMIRAVEALWRIPRPGPDNLLSAQAFIALTELCTARYGGKAVIALSTALRSLGLPCTLPAKQAGLALDPASVADAIDQTFTRKTTLRRHLCPLDLADELPQLRFGRTRVAKFSAGELETMFDAPKLARNFPTQPLEAKRLAQFHWLVTEEEIEVDPRPEARSIPLLFMNMRRDFGEIEAHFGRFPPAVEAALFFLLLAPWEEWSIMQEVDWRGFRIPWIYTVDEDLFVRPGRPPSPDSLTLEPWIVEDGWGDEIERERPSTFSLDDAAKPQLVRLTNNAWAELHAARATGLFETPIVHFLVRAFLGDGMDEIMAHMTAIEAALGLRSDFGGRRASPSAPKLNAKQRVAKRIELLLEDPQAGLDYGALFEIRSAFVHGRSMDTKVASRDRNLARRIARRVVAALVDVANSPDGARTREDYLEELA
jgi:hypothetical protein